MKRCNGKDFLVRYGDWFEVYSDTWEFLGSYKATSDMCEDMLGRFLNWKLEDVPHENYKIKKIRSL